MKKVVFKTEPAEQPFIAEKSKKNLKVLIVPERNYVQDGDHLHNAVDTFGHDIFRLGRSMYPRIPVARQWRNQNDGPLESLGGSHGCG